MVKPLTYRIIALFFAFYLPLALVGVPLHKHYCEGQLASFNIFVEAESCHDAEADDADIGCCAAEDSCHSTATESDCTTGDCCDNEVEILKVDLAVILNKGANLYDLDLTGFVSQVPSIHFEISDLTQIVKPLPPQPFNPFPESRLRLISQGKFLC